MSQHSRYHKYGIYNLKNIPQKIQYSNSYKNTENNNKN